VIGAAAATDPDAKYVPALFIANIVTVEVVAGNTCNELNPLDALVPHQATPFMLFFSDATTGKVTVMPVPFVVVVPTTK
jgi:hypothetical protein